jgi:hypothetical protein
MTFTVQWSVLRSAAKGAWPLALAVLGVFDALVVAAGIGWLRSMRPGDAVQTAGTILSLLGIWTTVDGLIELRGRFKGPLRASISSWFALLTRAFKKPQNVTVHAGGAALSVTLGSATLTAVGVTAPPTVDQRLSALEQDVRELRAEIGSATSGLRDSVSTLTRDLQTERREREEGDRRALQEVEGLAAGGFDVAMVGVCWTLFGAVLASPVGVWVGEWACHLLAR